MHNPMDDRLVRELTRFLREANLMADYEHARAHAEAFASGFAQHAPPDPAPAVVPDPDWATRCPVCGELWVEIVAHIIQRHPDAAPRVLSLRAAPAVVPEVGDGWTEQECVFVPAHEPWTCSVHQGIRTRLDEPRCDRVRVAEPFNDAYLDNIRQAIAGGHNPSSLYITRRLLATIDSGRAEGRGALDVERLENAAMLAFHERKWSVQEYAGAEPAWTWQSVAAAILGEYVRLAQRDPVRSDAAYEPGPG